MGHTYFKFHLQKCYGCENFLYFWRRIPNRCVRTYIHAQYNFTNVPFTKLLESYLTMFLIIIIHICIW